LATLHVMASAQNVTRTTLNDKTVDQLPVESHQQVITKKKENLKKETTENLFNFCFSWYVINSE
jgi:hypothetical protein